MSDIIFPLNSSMSERIFIEQVKMLYGNIWISIIGTLLTAIVSVWLLSDSVSHVLLFVWFIGHLFVGFVRGVLYIRFSTTMSLERSFKPHFWAWSYASTALFSGIIWGSLPWLAMDTTSLMNTLMISFVVTGMVVSSIGATAAFLPVFLMFSIPAGGMLAARFFVETGMLAEISSLLLLFLLGSISFTISLNHIFRKSISQRFERDALLLDVEEKRKEAERANRDKSRFLASASHDLRQPLHALNLYLSSMSIEEDPKSYNVLLNKAQTSSVALGDLLNSLLDISGLDGEAVQPQYNKFALLPLLEACSNEFAPIASEEDVTLKVRCLQGVCIETDSTLFGRMLSNLVSNAIRHSQSDKVLIAARQRGKYIRVEVWDAGRGIAAGKLDDIFSEFYQLNNPERDRQKGLGLGLAIVRRLSFLLKHPVSVCSRVEQGSCFSLMLPASPPIEAVEQATCDGEFLDISGMFVLLVDDDVTILDAMRGWLRLRACEVLVASSCVELVEKLASHEYPVPDVMIADYRLRDGETGLRAVAEVRNYYRNMLPAMIVSGDTSPSVVEQTKEAQCHCLAKPVTEVTLVRALSAFKATSKKNK